MATSGDINPDFITATPVSKEQMKQQLRNIKEAIAALEGQFASSDYPWEKQSDEVLSVATSEVRVSMPDGYTRYRIEYEGVRGVGVNMNLRMRYSTDNGASFATSPGSYDGNLLEWNHNTVTPFPAHDSGSIRVTGVQLPSVEGAFGVLEFIKNRTACEFTSNYITTGSIRNACKGYFGLGGTANMVQFFAAGFAPNLAPGARFTLLARP